MWPADMLQNPSSCLFLFLFFPKSNFDGRNGQRRACLVFQCFAAKIPPAIFLPSNTHFGELWGWEGDDACIKRMVGTNQKLIPLTASPLFSEIKGC